MKRAFLWLLAAGLIAAVGCGPRGDDDDDDSSGFTLESGVYTFSGTVVNADGCGTGLTAGDFDGGTTELVINGSTIEVDGGSSGGGFDLALSGNSASGSETDVQDFNPGLDCILDVVSTVSGTLTANNEIDVTQDIDASVNAGASCDQLGITLPCNTSFDTHLSRTGDIP